MAHIYGHLSTRNLQILDSTIIFPLSQKTNFGSIVKNRKTSRLFYRSSYRRVPAHGKRRFVRFGAGSCRPAGNGRTKTVRRRAESFAEKRFTDPAKVHLRLWKKLNRTQRMDCRRPFVRSAFDVDLPKEVMSLSTNSSPQRSLDR